MAGHLTPSSPYETSFFFDTVGSSLLATFHFHQLFCMTHSIWYKLSNDGTYSQMTRVKCGQNMGDDIDPFL